MKINADDVKRLHEDTGVGLMQAKKALIASDGNYEKAIEWLKENTRVQSLIYHSPISDDCNTDAVIGVNTKPITFKVDNLISKTVGGEVRVCRVCGSTMKQHTIYPYNSSAEKVYTCENKECPKYGMYTIKGGTNEYTSK